MLPWRVSRLPSQMAEGVKQLETLVGPGTGFWGTEKVLLAASESLTLTYRGGYPAQIPGVYALQDLTTFSYRSLEPQLDYHMPSLGDANPWLWKHLESFSILAYLAGSAGRACDSCSQGRWVWAHAGHKDYLKKKQQKKSFHLEDSCFLFIFFLSGKIATLTGIKMIAGKIQDFFTTLTLITIPKVFLVELWSSGT